MATNFEVQLEDQKNVLLKIAGVRKKHDLGKEVVCRWLHLQVKHIEEDLQDIEELQDFTIVKDFGQGATGMVLEASWLGHQSALKILHMIDKTKSTDVSLFHHWEVQIAFKSYIVTELMPTVLWRFFKFKWQQSSSPTQGGKCIGAVLATCSNWYHAPSIYMSCIYADLHKAYWRWLDSEQFIRSRFNLQSVKQLDLHNLLQYSPWHPSCQPVSKLNLNNLWTKLLLSTLIVQGMATNMA